MCIFCKIVNKEIPAKIVYEDEDTMAFLDINPRNKGHTLVIPKKHYETLDEMPDEELAKLMKAVKKVVEILKPLNFDGYNIINNNKPAAGQEVPHVHFHIIPRYQNDGDVVKFGEVKKIDLDEVEKIIKQ
ncbi:HIT family protein [Methanotorris igneus]|uniref:Histidine triad (HIT) protein n=1 Tax=Methanotorris igneus (strain DSM 5666 / JCM 11834 / Kol 5) TaxID=880724 RepID=F6BAQ5_METIK|nr:HIT family protein [Methanotorris igneus]AEF95869.1 histidine triad (HIT) protein [Methanotorris igneus Kol 5]